MRVSPEGIAFIKRREGVKNEPYKDSAGLLTVGVGHLLVGSVIKERYSDAEIDAFLLDDLAIAEQAVNGLVMGPLAQHEFDALCSLIFNIGVRAFRKSTLLKYLNAGKKADAADEFLKWRKAGGKVVKGLEKRRALERAMFLEGEYA